MTEEELKKLLERVDNLEKDMKAKDEKITQQENTIKDLTGKLASVKVDGLVKKVEEQEQPKVEEEITFDFDV